MHSQSDPLFGERKPQARALFFGIGAAVTIWFLFCLGLSIANSVMYTWKHGVSALALTFVYVLTIITYMWNRNDPDSRISTFNILMIVLIVGVGLSITFLFPFHPPEPPLHCDGPGFFMNLTTKTCYAFPDCSTGLTHVWSGSSFSCANLTHPPCPAPPKPTTTAP
ncbi:hypothetical protein PROFUN_06002 [Planoprotostelium fungivorum]|uniref:Uncharacterized protein n=1 Tax=Planoprotostelium fungivorum TaxID=1890364 RepID=A0A2P6NPC6_9EUKA|nr:hypothetical protein PROFUN_06002 [Planoprotostelium fungivorum]